MILHSSHCVHTYPLKLLQNSISLFLPGPNHHIGHRVQSLHCQLPGLAVLSSLCLLSTSCSQQWWPHAFTLGTPWAVGIMLCEMLRQLRSVPFTRSHISLPLILKDPSFTFLLCRTSPCSKPRLQPSVSSKPLWELSHIHLSSASMTTHTGICALVLLFYWGPTPYLQLPVTFLHPLKSTELNSLPPPSQGALNHSSPS